MRRWLCRTKSECRSQRKQDFCIIFTEHLKIGLYFGNVSLPGVLWIQMASWDESLFATVHGKPHFFKLQWLCQIGLYIPWWLVPFRPSFIPLPGSPFGFRGLPAERHFQNIFALKSAHPITRSLRTTRAGGLNQGPHQKRWNPSDVLSLETASHSFTSEFCVCCSPGQLFTKALILASDTALAAWKEYICTH